MHFEDLSEYSYHRSDDEEPALNVGWLDSRAEFTTGTVPAGFLEKLRIIMRSPYKQMRGGHVCAFCEVDQVAFDSPDNFKFHHEEGRLSSREIRVIGADGTRYAAPYMIAHYVEKHGYCPPPEFVDAVMSASTIEQAEQAEQADQAEQAEQVVDNQSPARREVDA